MPSTPEVKLSIVVAMYDIEGYIRYCLESCINQVNVQASDFEIIVINDGSTDGSLGIAEEIAGRASNVKIVSQDNAGLSAARNTGMDNARGEYIWFVDGDDAIAPDAVSTILSYIAKDGADAYICNFSTFETGDIIETSNFKAYNNLSGAEIHEKYLHILPMMAWLTIYRLACLQENGLKFSPGICHEDKEFSVRAHHCLRSISFVKEALYHYRTGRSESIMSDMRQDNTKSLASEIAIIDSFIDFFKDTPFRRKLLGLCASTFMIRRYDSAFVRNTETTNLIKENKRRLYGYLWRSGQWKMRALLIFIKMMPECVLRKALPKIGDRSKLM